MLDAVDLLLGSLIGRIDLMGAAELVESASKIAALRGGRGLGRYG